jgi:uncharacterized protein (TIGR00369 family)
MTEFDVTGEPWRRRGGDGVHIGETLGLRRTIDADGATVTWDAPAAYGFPTEAGPIIHGGMVTTILDTAMGGAAWTVMGDGETFLTAELRVEFLRPARPGLLRARGTVVRRSRRVVFCSAEAFDADGEQVAAARCTQVVLPAST